MAISFTEITKKYFVVLQRHQLLNVKLQKNISHIRIMGQGGQEENEPSLGKQKYLKNQQNGLGYSKSKIQFYLYLNIGDEKFILEVIITNFMLK